MQREIRNVVVYNKKMEKIAIFSNNTSANTDEARKNLMVNPTPRIVSNGESVLTFEMLSSSSKWNDIKDPENIYECNGRHYTALNTNSVVYSGEIVSVTLVETWYLLKKVFVQAHNVDTKIESIDEHTVKILPKTDKKFKLTVNGVQYDDSEVTDQRGVKMPRGSAGYALWAILKGTDWKLGVCDVLPTDFDASKDYGTFNVESDMKSALENIQFIQSLYGGILVWDSINKTLSLRDEAKENSDFNQWKGYTIRPRKNLKSHPEITWDNDIITRLYPLGNGNLNIKKVNNDKSYIENFSYTNKVYSGYIQNSNIYDTRDTGGQKTLKFWAEKKLEKLCKPRKSIKYDIIDMRGTPEYFYENFDVNDIVKAYYVDEKTGNEIWEYVRIQELSFNWFFPSSDSVIVVGDKVANEVELFNQIYKKVENSAPTDNTGFISADDIMIEIPDYFLGDFGYLEDYYGMGYTSLNQITKLHAVYEEKTNDRFIHNEAGIELNATKHEALVIEYTQFKKETSDNFVESNTQISQVSNELKAQISLEADHYKENKQGIASSNARIDVVASDLSAQISLEASHYRENQDKITQTSARINAVANDLGSRIDAVASTADNAGKTASSALSLATTANNSSASIATRVGKMESYFGMTPGAITISSGGGASINIVGGKVFISGQLYYRNVPVGWSNGHLVSG